MVNRRFFIELSAGAAGGLILVKALQAYGQQSAAQVSCDTLDPASIEKYIASLVIPPAMPRTSVIKVNGEKDSEDNKNSDDEKNRNNYEIDYYEIAVRQFQQQILPSPLPATTVWGYGSIQSSGTVGQGGSFNYPSFTIEARYNRPVRVKWINDLVENPLGDGPGKRGMFLPHLLPVDPTVHWANPPGGKKGRDSRPTFTSTPGPYTGPVPMVAHVHGAVGVGEESDGYTEAWFLPEAKNIPGDYAKFGTFYEMFKKQFKKNLKADHPSDEWQEGTATFQYPNKHRAATLWYHDHTLGMTRLNVYAGPAGFFNVRGGPDDLPPSVLPGPAPQLGDPPGTKYYEIPIAVQDRAFKPDGSLWFYPPARQCAGDTAGNGPFIPNGIFSPIWTPEFFGDTIVVSGKTWPKLEIEPRRYRFRFLNGCDSRYLILKIVSNLDQVAAQHQAKIPAEPFLKFWQIGSEAGFLPIPANLDQLLISPAERADVIVDFTNLSVGTEFYLINEGPDGPFGGIGPDYYNPNPGVGEVADLDTTGQVMKLRVVPLTSPDTSTPPAQLQLPTIKPIGKENRTRSLALLENLANISGNPSAGLMLGTISNKKAQMKMWQDPVTENPQVGDIEIWEFYNFTMDAHPIHIHEVAFQVVNRQAVQVDPSTQQLGGLIGVPIAPQPWETGFKDTVTVYPGQVTRVKAQFNTPGLFVWHCHIVEHEDNEMMRPYYIGPIPKDLPKPM